VPDDPLGWLELADMQVKCWLLEDALASLDRAEKSGDVPAAAASALRASVASRLGDATSSLALYEELVVDGCETFASTQR
jgi:hypothetical protein